MNFLGEAYDRALDWFQKDLRRLWAVPFFFALASMALQALTIVVRSVVFIAGTNGEAAPTDSVEAINFDPWILDIPGWEFVFHELTHFLGLLGWCLFVIGVFAVLFAVGVAAVAGLVGLGYLAKRAFKIIFR